MDKRAAAQYLDKIYGSRTGYVAVAHKGNTEAETWSEQSFPWPSGKADILTWADDAEKHGDVFVCPALRTSKHTRKKKDMVGNHRWLWADVDWQAVPHQRVADVKARIESLATAVYLSGSDQNVHVYVELSDGVEYAQFAKLNTGLKDYLYADAKQADNSLLRLPGTRNWKGGGAGVVVKKAEGTGGNRKQDPNDLWKMRAFRDARVIEDVEATEWTFVEMDGLPRRTKALVGMSPAEAVARYGNRHKAVWAVTGELGKRGMGPDEIHSLMDKFPAALDKMSEENGYDVHRDVDKRLAYDRATAMLSHEEMEEVEEEAFDLASEEDDTAEYEARVTRLALAEMERSEARRRARTMEAERAWSAPPDDTSSSLSDLLRHPPAPTQYLIDGLCSAQGFVVLAGQYKTGKTALMVNTLLTSLSSGKPFLDRQVHVPDGGAVCGHWNFEMSPLDLIDKYMRKAGYENPDNVHIANWQGYGVNLLTEQGKALAVEWLTTRAVKVWTIDSWTALCRMCGVDSNEGAAVGRILQVLSEIKREADVDVVFMLAHIARGSRDTENPGTKGAVELDAFVDTRWTMTEDASRVRFLASEGRGTAMSPISLVFDEDTGRSTAGAAGKVNAATEGWIQEVAKIVQMYPQGINEGSLHKLMKERGGPGNKTKAVEYMVAADEADFIVRKKARPVGVTGGRIPWMHFPANDGPVEGDRSRNATPAEIRLSASDVRPRTRPR